MFSDRETAIIKIIGKKKMTLSEIATTLFMHSYEKPFDPTIAVANSVSRIIKKCKHHKLDWTYVKNRVDGQQLS